MALYDILLLGATGFTGRLILRYLNGHPQYRHRFSATGDRPSEGTGQTFTFAITGRSQAKLDDIIKELDIDTSKVKALIVDVADEGDLEQSVKNAKVVINAIGPFWRWGTPVLRACIRSGTHYVDIAGELPWIREVIDQFDNVATKNHTIVVPSCGMDSIPSDYSVYLSKKTLDKVFHSKVYMESSTTVYNFEGSSLSGGSWETILAGMEDVPNDKLACVWKPFVLSPVQPPENIDIMPRGRLLYRMPYLSHILGGFFSMSLSNIPIVERTWGLLEYKAVSGSNPGDSTPESPRYGPLFRYDEFVQSSGVLAAVTSSACMMAVLGCLRMFRLVRWLFRQFVPQPGQGPSQDSREKGYFTATNITVASSEAVSTPIIVKSRIKGNGDPPYHLTSIMAAESALSIIFSYSSLPFLAQQGGVLTPVTTFGDVLIERLTDSGRFEFASEVLQGKYTDERTRADGSTQDLLSREVDISEP